MELPSNRESIRQKMEVNIASYKEMNRKIEQKRKDQIEEMMMKRFSVTKPIEAVREFPVIKPIEAVREFPVIKPIEAVREFPVIKSIETSGTITVRRQIMKIGTETPTGRKQERNKKSRKGLTVDLKGIKVKGAKKFLGL